MLSSKQRAFLRKSANSLDAIFHIGKNGLSPEFTQSIDDALEANELIKIDILNNSDEDPREIAETISSRTKSDVVQIIGRKIVLYRPSKKVKKIELPVFKK